MKLLRCLMPRRRNEKPDDSAGEGRNDEMEVEDSVSSVNGRRVSEAEEKPSERERELEGGVDRNGRGVAAVRERRRATDGPPVDDNCPICFGGFDIPCRAPCGHWYCGGCILQYWNYVAALQPCKCPMCSRQIKKLIPETSLRHRQEEEVIEVLQKVQTYNSLFCGGAYGLLQRAIEWPKRVFRDMMEPDRVIRHLHKMRLFAIFLGGFYRAFHFDFLPTGGRNAVDFFDLSAIALIVTLYLVGLYRRRQRLVRIRQLAAGHL